eukprot:1444351-Lingulodinium_polyedra.AAC.1
MHVSKAQVHQERTKLRKLGWSSVIAPGQAPSQEQAVGHLPPGPHSSCLGGSAAISRLRVQSDPMQDWADRNEAVDIAPMVLHLKGAPVLLIAAYFRPGIGWTGHNLV